MNSNNSQVSVPANSLDSYPVVKAGFGGDFLLFVFFCALIWGGWELVTRWRRSNANGSGSSSTTDYDDRGNTGRTTYVSRRPGVTHVVDEDPTVFYHHRRPDVVVVPTYPTVFVEEAPRDRVFVEENPVSGGTFVEEQPVSGGSVVEEEPVGYEDNNFGSGVSNAVEEEPVGYQDSGFNNSNNAVEEEPVGYEDNNFSSGGSNDVVEETPAYEAPSYETPADTTDYSQF